MIGSSWESFVKNQRLAVKKDQIDLYFYRTHQGAEIDVVFTRGLHVIGTAEIKYTNSPVLSKGNYVVFEDLMAPVNFVITPSSDDFLIKEGVWVCSLKTFVINYLPSF